LLGEGVEEFSNFIPRIVDGFLGGLKSDQAKIGGGSAMSAYGISRKRPASQLMSGHGSQAGPRADKKPVGST
jgi:hypothetical protein